MADDSPRTPRTPGRGPEADAREAERRARQAAALRENLRKRKAQNRVRRAPEEGGGDAD